MADMFGDLQGMGLTPQEINKVAYHRQNLGNPFINQEGNPMTIYATGILLGCIRSWIKTWLNTLSKNA